MKQISVLFIVFFLSANISAQPGSTCSNPVVVSALPYSQSGMTTAASGNNYDASASCGSSYMSGNDFVFSYTAPADMQITVILTGTGPFAGIFVIKGCPDSPSAVCVADTGLSGGNPSISYAQLLQDSTYYIIVSTNNYFNLFPSTMFNIEVREVYDWDAATLQLFQPRTRCNLSATDTVVALIKNQGTQEITSLQVGYSINGGTPVLEPYWHGNIAPGADSYYHFQQQTAGLTTPGLKEIRIFTVLAGDENPSNDTVYFPVWNNEFVNNYPYYCDFETSDGNWVSQWLKHTRPGSSWEHGTPSAPVINHAASGTQCYVTNLTGNTLTPEESYIQGPCFDFSGLTNPVLEMDIWYETGAADMAYIQYSLEANEPYTHWFQLGAYQSGVNWYNIPGTGQSGWRGNSGDWIHVRQTCDGLGGNPYVLFRIVFEGSFQTTCEGVAIDNISISESPVNDLSIVQLVNPVSVCGMDTDSVTIKITNRGLNAQVNPEVRYSIDNGATWVSENMNQTINFGDTVVFTFSQPAAFPASGLYPVIAKTVLAGDQFPSNDSVLVNIMNFPNLTFPYSNDFETDNGNWLAEGLNSSWDHGIPAKAIIDHAASGSNAWVTNLTGLSSELELSTLTSPCIDITGKLHPHLKLNAWYEIVTPGYCQLQYKDISGTNWAVLGSASDTLWYISGYSWNQSSGGWVPMKHSLEELPDVFQLRLNFQSPLVSDGFAFDDFVLCEGPEASFEQVFITKGFSICVNSLSQNFDSLLWTTSDGQTSTDSITPICFTGYTSSAQMITVTLVAYNSCTTDTFSLVLSPVDDIEEYYASHFSIYPNPFDESISVQSDIGFEKWELADITGRIMLTGRYASDNTVIKTGGLKKGSYLLRIYTNDGHIINKPAIKD